MKSTIGKYEVELDNTMIYIRESGNLVRTRQIRSFEAVSKFNEICKSIGDKFGIQVKAIQIK